MTATAATLFKQPSARRAWGLSALAVVGACLAILLYRNDPANPDSQWASCVFRDITGWYCIGCGMTRACYAMLHGHPLHAFAMNPLGVTLMPVAALSLAWWAGWQPRMFAPLMRVLNMPKLWMILLPAYWIARNLPWAPFHWLAPGGLNW
ncbi:DUF2752 domain-containing protein [Solilutibacter silvestris]|uniref:DUF2752 domain-containing protein n=1 Tax=Solilutibacter silvestris TaxID=1645665 RepID=UPI003D345134